jgi:transcriptional regulator with XRE-family HTH domain
VHYSYEKFLVELGKKLKELRKERGLTLRDMIVVHGFHLTHWQSFEKGKAISVPSLLRICEAFQLPLESLIAELGHSDTPEQGENSPSHKTVKIASKGRKSKKSSESPSHPSPPARLSRHKA